MHDGTDIRPAHSPCRHPLRLLPWQGPEGRRTHLIGDMGYLSRLADETEAVQLGCARAVWDLAPSVLDDPAADPQALRFAARRLHESLGDLLRMATPAETYVVAVPPASPYVRRWTHEPRSVSEARRDLHHVLAAWGLDDVADSAEAVLCELLTNSVRHADVPDDCEIETRYELLPDRSLRIEVHDADEARPSPRSPAPDAERGRGLALVDALTGGRWGAGERTGVGKCVWAVCSAP